MNIQANCQKSVRFSPTQQTTRGQDLQMLSQQTHHLGSSSNVDADRGQTVVGSRVANFANGLEWQIWMLERKFAAKLMSAILTLLLVYMLLGAFAYSSQNFEHFDGALVDGLMSVFALLSTSEFLPHWPTQPTSANTDTDTDNIRRFQWNSNSNSNSISNSTHHSIEPENPATKQSDRLLLLLSSDSSRLWSSAIECLYLLGGLNLVVSALNLARISLDNWRSLHLANGEFESQALQSAPKCNGQLLTSASASASASHLVHSCATLTRSQPSLAIGHSSLEPEALEIIGSSMTPTPIARLNDEHISQFMVQPNLHQATATISSATSSASTNQQHSQRQAAAANLPQSAYNLTELFVVSQQEPSRHHHHHHLHHKHGQLSRHDDAQGHAAALSSTVDNPTNKHNTDQFNYIHQTLTNQPSDLSLTISSTDQSICTHINNHNNNNNNSARIYQHHHSNMGSNSPNCQLVGSLNGREDGSIEIDPQILYESDSIRAVAAAAAANNNNNNNTGVINSSKLEMPFGTLMTESASNYSILSQGAPSHRRKHSDLAYLENGISCGHQIATLGRKRPISENRRQNGSNNIDHNPKELGSFIGNPKLERNE